MVPDLKKDTTHLSKQRKKMYCDNKKSLLEIQPTHDYLGT